jgi:hypothetical protein
LVGCVLETQLPATKAKRNSSTIKLERLIS